MTQRPRIAEQFFIFLANQAFSLVLFFSACGCTFLVPFYAKTCPQPQALAQVVVTSPSQPPVVYSSPAPRAAGSPAPSRPRTPMTPVKPASFSEATAEGSIYPPVTSIRPPAYYP